MAADKPVLQLLTEAGLRAAAVRQAAVEASIALYQQPAPAPPPAPAQGAKGSK